MSESEMSDQCKPRIEKYASGRWHVMTKDAGCLGSFADWNDALHAGMDHLEMFCACPLGIPGLNEQITREIKASGPNMEVPF